jgi:hypothetical protein
MMQSGCFVDRLKLAICMKKIAKSIITDWIHQVVAIKLTLLEERTIPQR